MNYKASIPTDPILYKQIVERVKARVKRWPSAYASGQVVKEYKATMHLRNIPPYKNDDGPIKNLTRWFKEKWIDILTGKPCGEARTATYYPTCRPSVKVSEKTPKTIQSLTAKERKSYIAQKQIVQEKTAKYTKSKSKF